MASKKGKRAKSKRRDGLLTERQRRDLLGLGLVLLALFTALSLVPPDVVGLHPGPAANLMGVVGSAFFDGGHAALGVGLYLVPLIPALGSLAAFGVRPGLALRWVVL
ncbi:MAG: hypothetical protein GWM90_29585, partial [Gemmatimonadetes bacterium]|nr:hypothetical protein [Gemmatimonadota bacterium]NIQ59237.1 hypothetical protein [Gemmatimonadota bacterium]NIU79420.1 hypothetical protein [Gammaproteobacteria bacterium]NIX48072.1 hypothetical protein [Gemmatimonadota bacterium]NIY12455.1 hypothetical protein [Gemmatimonadota bacterium]